jgi:hypothetical protein
MGAKPSFKLGLVQMSMSARPEDNLAKAVEEGRLSVVDSNDWPKT